MRANLIIVEQAANRRATVAVRHSFLEARVWCGTYGRTSGRRLTVVQGRRGVVASAIRQQDGFLLE